MRIFVEGVGLLGPGLTGWPAGSRVLAGNEPYVSAPIILLASELLPPAERRRTGVPVKLALAVGHEAFVHAGRDAAMTATVFTSSGGDGDNVHQICETLAVAQLEVSPTRFHNSVHNAAAGYWSIASGSREPSTSVCGYDASFAVGLLEAAAQIVVDGCTVALIAYDHPYPEPLHAVREMGSNFATALILTAQATDKTFAMFDVSVVPVGTPDSVMSDDALETLRTSVPAARSLPLLATLARKAADVVLLGYVGGNQLRVAVTPC